MATTYELIALGNDGAWRQRVRALFMIEAGVVYNENPATSNHAARATFASNLMKTPGLAESLAPALASRTNIAASDVSYDFEMQRVISDATDAEIQSQIATDFNMFAGV